MSDRGSLLLALLIACNGCAAPPVAVEDCWRVSVRWMDRADCHHAAWLRQQQVR